MIEKLSSCVLIKSFILGTSKSKFSFSFLDPIKCMKSSSILLALNLARMEEEITPLSLKCSPIVVVNARRLVSPSSNSLAI